MDYLIISAALMRVEDFLDNGIGDENLLISLALIDKDRLME